MKRSWKRNSSFPTSFIETHWYIPFHFLQPGRIAVPFLKRSSSSYKQTFTIFSRGKKPLFSQASPYLNYNSCLLGCPQRVTFQHPWRFSFFSGRCVLPIIFHRRLPSDRNCWNCLLVVSVICLFCPFPRFQLLQRSMEFSLQTTLVYYPLNWDIGHWKFLTIIINSQGASLVHPGENLRQH